VGRGCWGKKEGSRRGIRSRMWVGGREGRGSICHQASSWLQKHLHTSLPCPLPQVLEVFPLPRAPPPQASPAGVGVGWGEASLSCLKDGGAGEAGLGAQTAACVGGMSSDALHPAVPALTWVPPLSPPGLVAAWPDSPGLLPRPACCPPLGRGLLRLRSTVLCPGKGLWGGERAAGYEQGCACQQKCVCQRVCLCARGRCGLGPGPRVSEGAGQLAMVHGLALCPCAGWFSFCLRLLYVSPALLHPQAQNSRVTRTLACGMASEAG
jgi:hypothetical protein